VNLRFSKSASLQQFFSHDAKTMQWWNHCFILCDRSLIAFVLEKTTCAYA